MEMVSGSLKRHLLRCFRTLTAEHAPFSAQPEIQALVLCSIDAFASSPQQSVSDCNLSIVSFMPERWETNRERVSGPHSALPSLASWSKSASSVSRQRAASPGLLSYLRLVHQVEVARLPNSKVSLNSEVLLSSKVSSKLQPRRHANLPHVPWSTRTLVS